MISTTLVEDAYDLMVTAASILLKMSSTTMIHTDSDFSMVTLMISMGTCNFTTQKMDNKKLFPSE